MSVLLVDSAALEQSVIPDGLRLVRFVAPHYEAARPVALADLTTGERKLHEGGGVSLAPAERDLGNIRLDVPWAGEVPTLDRHGNARLGFTLRLLAGDPVADADTVVAAIIAAPGRAAIEWRRGGRASYYPLRGDADWTPTYRMRERQQGAGMLVAFSVEVAPYAHRGSMDVVDEFSVDSLGDYTFDAGAGTLQVLSGSLVPVDLAEKRLHHSARGFHYADAQATAKLITAAAVAPTLLIQLVRLDADNALEVGLVNGFTVVRKRDGGVITDLASGAVQDSIAGAAWIRARKEGGTVVAELWTAQPTPTGTPLRTVTHALAAADASKFGGRGDAGMVWAPNATADVVDAFDIEPYTYRARTFPQILVMEGAVLGDLPALCDLYVTRSGTDIAFGLAAWWRRPNGAHFIGGSGTAWWPNPTGAPDVNEDGEYELDVWATVSTVGTRVLSASSTYSATRYGSYGEAGVPVTTAGSRLVYLGRIAIAARGESALRVNTTVDQVLVLPARRLVRSPIGVANDAAYPRFARTTNEETRVLHADGAGSVGPPNAMMRDHGLGSRIEVGPGELNFLLRFSNLVPHDPNIGANSETAIGPTTVHARLLPRFVFA